MTGGDTMSVGEGKRFTGGERLTGGDGAVRERLSAAGLSWAGSLGFGPVGLADYFFCLKAFFFFLPAKQAQLNKYKSK